MGSMDMPVRPPSHTVSTFYHLLFLEFPVILLFLMIGIMGAMLWKQFGASIMKELGVEKSTGLNRYEFPHDAPKSVRIGRLFLVYALGLLWMLDGVLQAQPSLGTSMLQDVIEPALSGQPPILLNNFLDTGTLLFQSRPLWFDSLTVWIQLLIGAGILFGPTKRLGRFALWTSFVWGLVVWFFGEGLGQVFNGGTWLTGAPGAVLFYVFIAFILLRSSKAWINGRVAQGIAIAFCAQWFIDAIVQSVPSAGFWAKGGLSGEILAMARMHQPHAMAAPLFAFGHALEQQPAFWNGLFVLIPLSLSVLWFTRSNHRFVWWYTVVVTAFSWWLGQDFGVVGGAGTDPNTGAPLLLMAVSLLWLPKPSLTLSLSFRAWLRRDKAAHRERRVPAN